MDDIDTRISDPQPSQASTDSDALDRLSLVQALRDFEVANGRVIDLTQRLVLTAEELVSARKELASVLAERDDLRARLETMSASHDELRETLDRTLQRKSVRLGEAIWSARRSMGSSRRDG